MIKKFEVEDIAKILDCEDEIENYFPCDRGEWIQWLMSIVDNPKYFIAGVIEDGVVGYVVAVDNAVKPFGDHVFIRFFHSSKNIEIDMEIKAALNKQARSKKAVRVRFVGPEEALDQLQAEQKGIFGGWEL